MWLDPFKAAEEHYDYCWRDFTPQQWEELDRLGNVQFRNDADRKAILLRIAAHHRRSRSLFGTLVEEKTKWDRIGRAARELLEALADNPRWLVFSDSEGDRTLEYLWCEWARATPAMLGLMMASAACRSADVDLLLAERAHLKGIRLTSNAKDWTAWSLFGALFNQMQTRWGFRVYPSKSETPTTRFASYFCSIIEPDWHLNTKQVSAAMEGFRKSPTIFRELERLRDS